MADVRLIDANALKEWLGCDGDNRYSSMIMDEIADHIDRQPTIDAVEVVHGRWCYMQCNTRPSLGSWYCSACERSIPAERVAFSKYCPNCGAKMDGKEG